jgi:hypothetical protein
MKAIGAVNRVFQNSAAFRITSNEIVAPPSLQRLSYVSHTMFSALRAEDSPAAISLRVNLWRLRTAAIHAVFPFAQLDLVSCLDQVASAAVVFPAVRDQVAELRPLLDQVIAAENPKERALEAILSLSGDSTFGLVAPDSRSAWTVLAARRFPTATVVRGVAALSDSAFPLLVVPSGGHRCPLWNRLMHTYRAPEIRLLHYRFERVLGRVPPLLPLSQKPDRMAATPLPPAVAAEDHDFDPFEGSTAWSSLRGQYAGQGATSNDFMVPARGVLLGESKRTFLAEGKEVIELSQALEQGRPAFDRLPRKAVRHLQPGDLILLRTRGSGDYLQDVVKQLLVRDHAVELRSKALEWKTRLIDVLHRVGPPAFCEMLREHGHDMRHNSRYVWMWTTDDVMRPHSLTIFRGLIASILAFTPQQVSAHTTDEAARLWTLMNDLLRYHHRAGAIIRRALLHRIADFAGKELSDESHLTLAGLQAGELTLFRIHAVEPEAVMTPYSATGTVHPFDAQASLWPV